MQNVLVMCEKFRNDQLRNDRALGDRKSDNDNNPKNKHKRATIVALGDPFLGPKISDDIANDIVRVHCSIHKFVCVLQGPIGLDGVRGYPVS